MYALILYSPKAKASHDTDSLDSVLDGPQLVLNLLHHFCGVGNLLVLRPHKPARKEPVSHAKKKQRAGGGEWAMC